MKLFTYWGPELSQAAEKRLRRSAWLVYPVVALFLAYLYFSIHPLNATASSQPNNPNQQSQAVANAAQSSSASPAPAIKGIQLGMTFHDLGLVMEGPITKQFETDRNKERKYFIDAGPIDVVKARRHYESTGPHYNPCIEHASAVGSGYIAIIYSDDGSLTMYSDGPRNIQCQLWVHADMNKKVDAFYMSNNAVNVLFQAYDMDASAFYQTFVNSYGISELHTDTKLQENYGNPDRPLPMEEGYFESPDGWRIDFLDKSFTMKSETPTSVRFN
jgi:hypothetical protein